MDSVFNFVRSLGLTEPERLIVDELASQETGELHRFEKLCEALPHYSVVLHEEFEEWIAEMEDEQEAYEIAAYEWETRGYGGGPSSFDV